MKNHIQDSYCYHCHIISHTNKKCWVIHPELKIQGNNRSDGAGQQKFKYCGRTVHLEYKYFDKEEAYCEEFILYGNNEDHCWKLYPKLRKYCNYCNKVEHKEYKYFTKNPKLQRRYNRTNEYNDRNYNNRNNNNNNNTSNKYSNVKVSLTNFKAHEDTNSNNDDTEDDDDDNENDN